MVSLNTYMAVAGNFLSDMSEIELRKKLRKEEILEEYGRTFHYPRKKKKRVRKELQLEYAILCWDPFDMEGLI